MYYTQGQIDRANGAECRLATRAGRTGAIKEKDGQAVRLVRPMYCPIKGSQCLFLFIIITETISKIISISKGIPDTTKIKPATISKDSSLVSPQAASGYVAVSVIKPKPITTIRKINTTKIVIVMFLSTIHFSILNRYSYVITSIHLFHYTLETVNNSTIESEVSTIMYYTQEQIDRANRAGLAGFLRGRGVQLKRAGNKYRCTSSGHREQQTDISYDLVGTLPAPLLNGL